MIPPRYAALEDSNQPFWRRKRIRPFGGTVVAMVAFSGFIVVLKHAHGLDDIRKPVLVSMARASQGLGKLPQDQLYERVLSVGDPSPK